LKSGFVLGRDLFCNDLLDGLDEAIVGHEGVLTDGNFHFLK
jgi:hypothetical protein